MNNDIILYMPYIWLATAVLLGVGEAITDQLVAIWFAIGAVVAMLTSYLLIPIWLQFFVFLIVSSLVLYLLRPFATKHLTRNKIKTNVNSLIGMIGVVTTTIDNVQSQGRIRVNNSDWAARSEDGQVIPEGEEVLVKAIQGVKLIVEPIL